MGLRLSMRRPRIEVTVDAVRDAFLDRTAGTLYVVDGLEYPAAAVARELLTGANVAAGHLPLLTTALEQVLAAQDADTAQEALDVRGFARHSSGLGHVLGATSGLEAAADGAAHGEAESAGDTEMGHSSPHPAADASTGPTRGYDAPPRRPQRRDERLRSYVATAREDDESEKGNSARHERNLEIDAAGTERVMAYERSRGRTPEKMTHLNKGYDVVSEDDFGNVRYIEIKSTVDLWGGGGVGITPAQHDYARRNPDEWWLYVVEAAESDDWAIYCINNFVERTYRYMFDDGWRVAAKEKAGNWRANEAAIKQPETPSDSG